MSAPSPMTTSEPGAPTLPLFELGFSEADRRAADEVLASGWITAGARVARFEEAFAQALGVEQVVAVASGTAALHLALRALELGPGDEVIVPALTFAAAANVVVAVGATPVFADVTSLGEPNLSLESLERVRTPRTRAVIPVHYAGYPCRVEPLLAWAEQAEVDVVEDAAHACVTPTPWGACGTLGALGAFSFFSNKNLAVGEGGALAVREPELATRLRRLRSHGMTTHTLDRHRGHAHTYDVAEPGLNYRWDELRAAIALERLARLPGELEARRALAVRYRARLAEALPELEVPFAAPPPGFSAEAWAEVPPHIFPVLLPDGVEGPARAALMDRLRARGVQTSIHYPLLPAFSGYAPSARGEWATAERYSARVLTLPFFPAMGEAAVERVVSALVDALQGGPA